MLAHLDFRDYSMQKGFLTRVCSLQRRVPLFSLKYVIEKRYAVLFVLGQTEDERFPGGGGGGGHLSI